MVNGDIEIFMFCVEKLFAISNNPIYSWTFVYESVVIFMVLI